MSVKRYRITVDVYADEVWSHNYETAEEDVRRALTRVCPLGVVEGYPDIQEIATDTPFVAADETHD